MTMTQEQKTLTSAWQERMSAMRNLPPVLKIVWDSGPVVVVLGFVFRLLAALQPVGLLYVSKLIIDTIVYFLQTPADSAAPVVAGGGGVRTRGAGQRLHPHHRLHWIRCWPTSTPATSAFR